MLPRKKMWEQAQPGYHDEGRKCDSVEGAEDDNKSKDAVREDGRSVLSKLVGAQLTDDELTFSRPMRSMRTILQATRMVSIELEKVCDW